MATEAITSEVAAQLAAHRNTIKDQQALSAVEIEVGNAMLREVNNARVSRGELAWPGVPADVAYIDIIRGFLTPDRIHRATEAAEQAMDPTQTSTVDLAAWLCKGPYSALWHHVIEHQMPQEVMRIKEQSLERTEMSRHDPALNAEERRFNGHIETIMISDAKDDLWINAVTAANVAAGLAPPPSPSQATPANPRINAEISH